MKVCLFLLCLFQSAVVFASSEKIESCNLAKQQMSSLNLETIKITKRTSTSVLNSACDRILVALDLQLTTTFKVLNVYGSNDNQVLTCLDELGESLAVTIKSQNVAVLCKRRYEEIADLENNFFLKKALGIDLGPIEIDEAK